MPNAADGSHFTERLGEIWSRRKWLALAVLACVAAGGVTAAVSLPDMYRATATVLVEDSSVDPMVATELDRRLQMITQEILSRKRLEATIYRFDLYPSLREEGAIEGAVHQMRRDISSQVRATSFTGGAGGTITLAVSYRGRDPNTVASVCNALAGFYLEQDRDIREREASGNVKQLADQLQELKDTLDRQEKEVSTFQDSHLGELPQQSEANLAGLEQLQAELRSMREERMRALDRRNDLLRRLAELENEEAAPAGAAPRSGPGRLEKLRIELADLQRRFSDRYPDVIRLKAEIATLEKEPPPAEPAPAPVHAAVPAATGRMATRLRESLSEVERQIETFKSDESRLRAGVDGYLQRLETAPRRQRAFQEVSRDYQTTRDLYDSLRKRYEQAQLVASTQGTGAGPRFRVLDEAVVPRVPAAPNRRLLMLFALLAGAGAALVATLVAERLDTSFKTADEVRGFTAVPVLASIPRMTTAAEARARRFRFAAAAVSLLLVIGMVVKASRVVARNNDALVAMLSRGQS